MAGNGVGKQQPQPQDFPSVRALVPAWQLEEEARWEAGVHIRKGSPHLHPLFPSRGEGCWTEGVLLSESPAPASPESSCLRACGGSNADLRQGKQEGSGKSSPEDRVAAQQ